MISGRAIHEAWNASWPASIGATVPWEALDAAHQDRYRSMAQALATRSGVCPACGSIPAEGLGESSDGKWRCGGDCPGLDSQKWCDHRSVGAVITNERGQILLFERGTYPFCVAGPAGHCDGDTEEDAIRMEVEQETGLLVLRAELLARFWHHSRCRRRYAGSHGHMWTFYRVQSTGTLYGSARETKVETLRYYRPVEIVKVVEQTTSYLTGEETSGVHLDLPWYQLFTQEMGYPV